MMIADNDKKCYSIHRQWGSPYLIVWCGNLTIQENGRLFYCFLFRDKIKLRHSLGRPSRSDFVHLQKYNFKTETKFSKLVAPNKYEDISFDDFVMFSRSCVELATYIFEKITYDYTKIVLDIPNKQVSKWRKYSKKRQEKALCSYIKTLYKADEEFIEQMPKLLSMIIDPIV